MRGLALILATALAGCAVPVLPPAPATPGLHVVEATGHADPAAGRDSAARRALADALHDAALAAGAEVRGFSVMDRSVITADLTAVRPLGRIVDWTILSDGMAGTLWQTRIRATVAEPGAGACRDGQRIVLTAYPMDLQTDAGVPAWAATAAAGVEGDLAAAAAAHPAVALLRRAPGPLPGPAGRGGDAMDFALLTGRAERIAPGTWGLVPALRLTRADRTATLTLDLALIDSAGGRILRQAERQIDLPAPTGLHAVDALTAPARPAQEAALTADLDTLLTDALSALACLPPRAVMVWEGGVLRVPLGTDQGLTAGSIGLATAPTGGPVLLAIDRIGARSADLRPLDPTDPARLAGVAVSFLVTGPGALQ